MRTWVLLTALFIVLAGCSSEPDAVSEAAEAPQVDAQGNPVDADGTISLRLANVTTDPIETTVTAGAPTSSPACGFCGEFEALDLRPLVADQGYVRVQVRAFSNDGYDLDLRVSEGHLRFVTMETGEGPDEGEIGFGINVEGGFEGEVLLEAELRGAPEVFELLYKSQGQVGVPEGPAGPAEIEIFAVSTYLETIPRGQPFLLEAPAGANVTLQLDAPVELGELRYEHPRGLTGGWLNVTGDHVVLPPTLDRDGWYVLLYDGNVVEVSAPADSTLQLGGYQLEILAEATLDGDGRASLLGTTSGVPIVAGVLGPVREASSLPEIVASAAERYSHGDYQLALLQGETELGGSSRDCFGGEAPGQTCLFFEPLIGTFPLFTTIAAAGGGFDLESNIEYQGAYQGDVRLFAVTLTPLD